MRLRPPALDRSGDARVCPGLRSAPGCCSRVVALLVAGGLVIAGEMEEHTFEVTASVLRRDRRGRAVGDGAAVREEQHALAHLLDALGTPVPDMAVSPLRNSRGDVTGDVRVVTTS